MFSLSASRVVGCVSDWLQRRNVHRLNSEVAAADATLTTVPDEAVDSEGTMGAADVDGLDGDCF